MTMSCTEPGSVAKMEAGGEGGHAALELGGGADALAALADAAFEQVCDLEMAADFPEGQVVHPVLV